MADGKAGSGGRINHFKKLVKGEFPDCKYVEK